MGGTGMGNEVDCGAIRSGVILAKGKCCDTDVAVVPPFPCLVLMLYAMQPADSSQPSVFYVLQ
jgi:hypothetical protein